MKLHELMKVAKHCQIDLVSGHDGRVVAKSQNTLEKYGDVEVLSVYPKIRINSYSDNAQPYLYVFGDANDIAKTKKAGDTDG